jgi:DnaJ-class molecular chaperone
VSTTSNDESYDGECGSTELDQTTKVTCDDCRGTGLVDEMPCEACSGTGTKVVLTKVSAARCLPADG